MKVRITQLKAPWPEGAKVGDEVNLPHDAVPVWAVNKCVPIADTVTGDGTGQALPDIEAINAQVADLQAALSHQQAQHVEAMTALQAELDKAHADGTALRDRLEVVAKDKDALQADLDKAKADLAAALAKKK